MVKQRLVHPSEVCPELVLCHERFEEFEGIVDILCSIFHALFTEELRILCAKHQRTAGAAGNDRDALCLPLQDSRHIIVGMFFCFIEIACDDEGGTTAVHALIDEDLVAVVVHDLDKGDADMRLIVVDRAARVEDDFLVALRLLDVLELTVECLRSIGRHRALPRDAHSGKHAKRAANLCAEVREQ